MKSCIFDKQTKCFVAYIDNVPTSDCWTYVPANATRFSSMRIAKQVRSQMAKICKIKVRDMIILTDYQVKKMW